MTSINSLPQKRAASVGTLLKNSRKRAPGALVPRGIIRGAQGPRVQLPSGLHAPRRRPTSVLTTRKRCSTVSCTEGRRYAGGELPRNWAGAWNAPHAALSLLITLSAIADSQKRRQVGEG